MSAMYHMATASISDSAPNLRLTVARVVSIGYGDDLAYAFQFFMGIRPSLQVYDAHEEGAHAVGGMEK